jgi:hypothetical protein
MMAARPSAAARRAQPTTLFAVAWSLLALGAIGCDGTIEVPNRAPTAAFESVERDGDHVALYYWLHDDDGDDVDITLTACLGARCFAPTPAPGGDGTRSLPTLRDTPVLHLFLWAASCDVTGADRTAEIVLHLVPHDGEDAGPAAQSVPFTLDGLELPEACVPAP